MEKTLTLIATTENTAKAVDFVESNLSSADNIDPTVIPQMAIVVDELFANVAHYAYPSGQAGEVTLEININNGLLNLTFIDSGISFDPTKYIAENLDASVEERNIGGLGIFLVKKMVDTMEYARKDNKNYLTIKKNILKKEK